MMASRALDREADLWDAAGITSNAAVVDLGCGPGIFLPELASRTAPAGRLVGVDESGPAVTAAHQLAGQVDQLDLGVRIHIVRARVHATGLALGTFDVVFIRNLLLHNGASASAILEHSHQLLRPGGHLFCVEAAGLAGDTPKQRDDIVFDYSNVSEGNEILPNREPMETDAVRLLRQSATIIAARWLVGRHQATSRDGSNVPSKQRVAGSNPAGRASQVRGCLGLLLGRAGSQKGSHSAYEAPMTPTARRRARQRTRPRSRRLTRQTPCGGTTNAP